MPSQLEKYGPLLSWFALVLGVILRLYHIGTYSLDIDEMVSVSFAQHSRVNAMLSDTNPPLFLLILRGWSQLFPHTEFWLRFPSFIFSTISLVLMSRLGWLPTLLMAVTPASLQAAQWCRGNSLWELATVISLYGILKSNRLMNIAGLVVASLTHWFAAFINVGLTFLIPQIKNNRWRATLLGLLAAIFTIIISIGLQMTSFHLDWQVMRFRSLPFTSDAKQQLFEICGGWPVLLMITIFLAWTCKHKSKENEKAIWLLFLVMTFGLLLVGLSLVTERSLFLARYMTPAVPVFAWAGATLILNSSLRPAIKLLPATFWIVCLSAATINYFQRPSPRWREALKQVAALEVKTLWTTRPVGIAHPYLENTEIKVRNFPGTRINTEELLESLKQGRTAILENYWGGLLYLAPTREYLNSLNIKTEEYVFSESTDEPLQLLIIDKIN